MSKVKVRMMEKNRPKIDRQMMVRHTGKGWTCFPGDLLRDTVVEEAAAHPHL